MHQQKIVRVFLLPTICTTRAESGTAETPAAPTSGLIFSVRNKFMNLANNTPPAVAMANDNAPSPKICSDWERKNVSACVLAPTEKPSKIVTMSIIAVRAVLASRSVTILSFSRLPKNSMPNSTIAPGAISVQIKKAATGKIIFSRLETFRGGFMRIKRSSRVVSNRMIGGWMTGTSAM